MVAVLGPGHRVGRDAEKKIHKVISHAGRSPVAPRIQYLKGEREYPDLSSRLITLSVKTTPNKATTEERSADRGKGSYSGPTDDGSKPRKAINQAGKSAMSPSSQCCRGPQLETHLLRYGIAAAVPNNPRVPRTMENLIISSYANLTHWVRCRADGLKHGYRLFVWCHRHLANPPFTRVSIASINLVREMGLIKYFATPALSALVFHSPTVMAVRTTMGMPDVAGSCLSITVASTAVISGRHKSVIMRSGRSAKALLIACVKFLAREISYPALL